MHRDSLCGSGLLVAFAISSPVEIEARAYCQGNFGLTETYHEGSGSATAGRRAQEDFWYGFDMLLVQFWYGKMNRHSWLRAIP